MTVEATYDNDGSDQDVIDGIVLPLMEAPTYLSLGRDTEITDAVDGKLTDPMTESSSGNRMEEKIAVTGNENAPPTYLRAGTDKAVRDGITDGLNDAPTYTKVGSEIEVNAAIEAGEKLPLVSPTRFGNDNDVNPPNGAPVSLYPKLFSIHSPAGTETGLIPFTLTPVMPTFSETAS